MVSFALTTVSTCSTLPASNAAALAAFCQGPFRPFDRAAGVCGQRVGLEKGLCISPCVRPRIDPLTYPFRRRCTRTATGLRYARSDKALGDFVVVKDMSDPLKGRSMGSMIGTFVAQVNDCFGIGKKRSASKSVRQAEDEERRRKRKDLWRRIGQVVKPEWPLMAVSTFFLVVAALIEVAVPHFSSSALNAILLQRGRLEFVRNVRSTVVLGILAAATTGMRGMCFGLAGTRIVCNLRHQLFKALLRQDIAFFDLNMTGELTNRLTSDCTKISNVVSLNVNIMARQTIQLIGGLAYLYRLHPAMAGVSAMGLASIFLLTGIHGQYNRSMGKKIQDALATSNSAAGTSLSLIRLVRSHASESEELSRYDKKLRSLVDLMMSHDLGYGVYRLVIRISQTALLAAALMLGYRLSAAGALSADQLTSCLFYVGFVSGASWDVGDQYVKIQDALGSATEVFKLLDQRPAMQLKTADNASLTEFSGPSATHTYFAAHASDGGSAMRAHAGEVMELVEDPVSHHLVDKRTLQQQQQQDQDQDKGVEDGQRRQHEDLHLGEEGSTHTVHAHHTSAAIGSHTPSPRELQRPPLPKDLISPPRRSAFDSQQVREKDVAGDAMVAPGDASNRDQEQRVGRHVASSAKGDIVFHNVSFAYPLRGNTPVLKGISLHIPPGRRVAIVGSSGGGKSTLLRLLCRHYDADSGSIMLDGKDVTSIPQSELASSVAMLSQEPPLLPISIGANIAYGLPPGSYSQKDIEEAARAANVHDFISSLPEGYNTQVGEGSVALSGGQKQRVAIARALIRKPRVLLLDEPTSALDAESEKAVQDALETASAGRTVLIVAHRLSTIQSAETIIVLKDGRIAEMGSHDELVRQRSLYASLWARQGSLATSAYA